jgi:hypothetical protein
MAEERRADNDPIHNSGNSAAHWDMHYRTSTLPVTPITAVPDMRFDGLDIPFDDGVNWYNVAQLQGVFDARRALLANMTLDVKAFFNPTSHIGVIKVRAECTAPTTATSLRLIINLWENNITRLGSGTNGETKFNWAVWRVYPSANGTIVTLRNIGDVYEGSYNIAIDPAMVDSNMGVTAFIQDFGATRYVEQAATSNFKEEITTITNPTTAGVDQVLSGTIPVTCDHRLLDQ